jgi:hypothetical protein
MSSTSAKTAIKLRQQSLHKIALASKTDPIRREFDLGEARLLQDQYDVMITPSQSLSKGLGDEIIPPLELGYPGLEHALKEPDLLDAEVTIKRTDLADKAGVFEMAIEAAESSKAKNSIQRMQAHQLALAHKYAMELMSDASKQRDPIIKVKLMNCSARLMEAYSKGALALQRLQTGASQVVQVQHVQVNGQAVIGNIGGRV